MDEGVGTIVWVGATRIVHSHDAVWGEKMRYAPILVLALVALAAMAQPSGASSNATIITYTVPVVFEITQNTTVPASNSTTLTYAMPYPLSRDAKVYLEYHLTTNGTLLSDASNITLKVSVDGSQLTTILLSSGSPAEAMVPLSATPQSNITVELSNNQTNDINASVTITVLDTARFSVSVSPQSLELQKGQSGSVSVTIKEESGPPGTLYLYSSIDPESGVTTTVTPSQRYVKPGDSFTATWTFQASNVAKQGSYTAKLTGEFEAGNLPGANAKYTFAEVLLPVAMESAAAGAVGFSLGALAGYKFGAFAVAIGILFIILIMAVALARR